MTGPVSGGVAWAELADIPAGVAEMHDPQTWTGHLATATDILWSATQKHWRGASLTEDAVLRAAPGRGRWAYHSSWGHDPSFAGFTSSGLPRWTGSRQRVAPYRVRLPRPDVTAVELVLVDGVEFAAWELDGSWLARTDGQPWHVINDRTVITYTFGRLPPEAGKAAVIELAIELGRASSDNPDQACQLPKRLQSVTRQGLTYQALDSLDFLDQGLTGLTSVDLWIKSVNPNGRTQAASVWSPDLPVARRRGR